MDLVGVIHLLPLPGAPVRGPGLQAVIDRAVRDARALVEGGIRAAIVENLGDAPFVPGRVDAHVVACMTAVCLSVRQATADRLLLGVNVLRNDAASALGVAAATGAGFVRVNVHTGAAWTDQGLVQGQAPHSLRLRRELDLQPDGPAAAGWTGRPTRGVRIVADVHVKHATPAGRESLEDAAADLALRGRADVVIVTGTHTGGATPVDDLRRVRERLPAVPLWVGSGLDPDGIGAIRGLADGAIVGTWLHQQGDLERALDPARVARLVRAAGQL